MGALASNEGAKGETCDAGVEINTPILSYSVGASGKSCAGFGFASPINVTTPSI